MSKNESKVNNSLRDLGNDLMGPITANWDKEINFRPRRKSNKVGYLAKKVVRKASFLATQRKSAEMAKNSSKSRFC